MKGISWKAISPINRIFPSKNNTYFFRIIGPYEHNNQTSNKVNNAINNNQ